MEPEKAVYRVEYEERYENSDEWLGDAKNVLAEDAQKAVDICREAVLAGDITTKVTGFRLAGVRHVAEVDLR